MALVDLVKITATSTGTGAITFGSAVAGFRGREVLTDGEVYSYSIQQEDEWEFGRGTYLAVTRSFVRSPIDSSNGGVAINLQANAAVALVLLSEDLSGGTDLSGVYGKIAQTKAELEAEIVANDVVSRAMIRAEFAAVTGAALVGTGSGLTVQQRIDAADAATTQARNNLAANTGAGLIGTGSGLTAQQRLDAADAATIQARNALAAVTGSALVGFQQAGTGAVARTVQDELRRFLTPEQFGCKVDGTTDDSTNFAKLVAAVNASPYGAGVGLSSGVMRLSTTSFAFTKPVTFTGQGVVQTQIHLYNNARIFFDGTRTDTYAGVKFNTAFAMRDLSVLTDGIHTSSPIHVNHFPSVPDGLTPTFIMDNVVVAGRNPTSGFRVGIEIFNTPWPRLTNVVIIGDYANNPTFSSLTAINYTGVDGSPAFRDVRIYFVQDAVNIEGEMEGVVIDGLETVAVTRGVRYADTTNGAQPMLSMTNCHINARECCLRTIGVTQFAIGTGNLFYGDGPGTLWTAIDITPSTSNSGANTLGITGRISDMTIAGQTSTATTKIGIRVRGTVGSIEDFQILGNRYESLSIGVQLDANTNGVYMDAANSFLNVVTPFSDSGAGNHRQQRSFMNTAVGTTDSSGQITIPIPTSGIVFTLPPFVMSEHGDGGGVTANVIQSSISTVSFKVQIASSGNAVAGGGTYRVNYVVSGF